MTCRTCGTEIADKALICYRCGTPTAPARASSAGAQGAPRQIRLLLAIVALVVILAGLAVAILPQGPTRTVAWVLLAGVAAVTIRRIARAGPRAKRG